ncbi:MAG TPA: hypothetical protein VFZ77_03355 [Acidimicrobiales bacterium]
MGQGTNDRLAGLSAGNARAALLGAVSLAVVAVALALAVTGVTSGEIAATLLFLPVFAAGLLGGRPAGYAAAAGCTVAYVALRRADLTAAGAANAGVLTLTRAGAYVVAGHVGALAQALVPAGAPAPSGLRARPAAGPARGRRPAGQRAGSRPPSRPPAWDESSWPAEDDPWPVPQRRRVLAGVGSGSTAGSRAIGDLPTTAMSGGWPPPAQGPERGEGRSRSAPDGWGDADDGGWHDDAGWDGGEGPPTEGGWPPGAEAPPPWQRGPGAAPDDGADEGGWGAEPQAADTWAGQTPGADPWGRAAPVDDGWEPLSGEESVVSADPWGGGASVDDRRGSPPGEPGAAPAGAWGPPGQTWPAHAGGWEQPAAPGEWAQPGAQAEWHQGGPAQGEWPQPGAQAGWEQPAAPGEWAQPGAQAEWDQGGPAQGEWPQPGAQAEWDQPAAPGEWPQPGPAQGGWPQPDAGGQPWDPPAADPWTSTSQSAAIWDDLAAGHTGEHEQWTPDGAGWTGAVAGAAAAAPAGGQAPGPAPAPDPSLPAVDHETGLWTARFLRDRLLAERDRSRRSGRPFSLVLVQVPDGPLAQLPYRRQVTLLRELGYQFVAGGVVDHLVHVPDETQHWFAVILPDSDRSGAQVLERRLRLGIGGYLSSRGLPLRELESASLTAPDDDPAMGSIWEALIGPEDG